MTQIKAGPNSLISIAWTRNGKANNIITGEALILACLLHTHGAGRDSDDFKTVQSLMDDINLESK